MKKRRLKADRAARREAYYEELRKLNVLDEPDNSELTKAQIIEKLLEMGIDASIKLKKDELLTLLENACKKDDIDGQISEQDEDNTTQDSDQDTSTDEEEKTDVVDTPGNSEDGSIEDIEIDEIKQPTAENTVNDIAEVNTEPTTVQDGTVEEIEV